MADTRAHAAPIPAMPSAHTVTITDGQRRTALYLLLAAYTLNYADRQVLGILTPYIMADMNLSATDLGFLGGFAFALFYATLGIPIAMWADRGRRVTIVTLSLAIWSGMTAVCGLANNFVQLALARVGVGIGEAGGSPPSHSLISDYYPPESRGTALAVYSLGVPIGLFIGLGAGGYVAATYGWREAFFVLGLPGLLLAVIVAIFLKEPPRGHADAAAGVALKDGPVPTVRETARFMWSQRSLRHLMAGGTLITLVGYAGVQWFPSFVIFSLKDGVAALGFEMAHVGLLLAILIGAGAFVGTYMGGKLSDVLGRRDVRWRSWVVAVAILFGIPFGLAVYLLPNATVALLLLMVPSGVGAFYLGPTYALTQALVRMRMRAVASAIALFIFNFIGMGLGPLLAGIFADMYQPTFGDDRFRWALLTLSPIFVWSAWHYFLAAKYLKQDLEAAAR
ncbi:spinster family MFS transporter [Zavarzinia sp. CC-PAN008]|uniref:spinster family MFS transporter n=1 Tax=Zavarzinia sp. CC-PAN008 TaxID=3243332 RepID=UPI003F743B9A